MQKIAKREKVKKKLNAKAPQAQKAENGGKIFFNLLHTFYSETFICCALPIKDSHNTNGTKKDKLKKNKLVKNPEQKVKKKKKPQKGETRESSESEDEEMEEGSDTEEINGAEETTCEFIVLIKLMF